MKFPVHLLAGIALFTMVAAAPHKIELAVDDLVLKNGQRFVSGTIRSYDHANGKVVLMADRKIVSIQLELLPDDLAEKIIAMVPEESKDETRTEKSERHRKQAEAKRNSEAAAKARTEETNRRRAESQARAAEATKASRHDQMKAETSRLARSRADRYFRYEFKPGSGATVQIRRDIDLEEPEEVAGWPNRFRVQGQIGLEYYDSKGRSFSTTSQRFEVTAQGDDRGKMTIVDFTVK